MRDFRRHVLRALLPIVAVTGVLALAGRPVRADDPDATAPRERCATRLSIALLGESASDDLITAARPQDHVADLLENPKFAERFARFVNAQLNIKPGATAADDAPYFLVKHVIANRRPWKDLFVGAYDVDANGTVKDDPQGLGYFRSRPWMVRYAGSEGAGYRLVAAYRILQNTTGLRFNAVTNAEDADVSAAGRTATGCKGCHYENWFALDKVARVLPRRSGSGDAMTFTPPTDGPQQILGGKTISDDKELVMALVDSEAFRVNACRLAFRFLYGREESTCEAEVFDRCVEQLATKGTMHSALAAIAGDPSYCQ